MKSVRRDENEEMENESTNNIPRPKLRQKVPTSSDESEAEILTDQDQVSEWEPGLSYQRNKARNESLADAIS
jgi:hypothetical protein